LCIINQAEKIDVLPYRARAYGPDGGIEGKRMSENRNQGGEELLLEMESDANAFNLKCLAVLCGLTLLCGLSDAM